MRLLIRRATIVDKNSKHHGKKRDILINKGIISKIARTINVRGTKIIEGDNLHVSQGWCDIGSQPGEPGFEFRENLSSLSRAAISGGFTTVACFPNTNPVVHSKSEVEYLINRSETLGINILPIGAITRDAVGSDIAEMQEMHNAGAVAFSDGRNSIRDSGIMRLALDYVKTFDGLIINRPYDAALALEGQMHEGTSSTRMGLSGIPDISEMVMLQRDLQLIEYTKSKLHVLGISSAEAVGFLKAFRSKSDHITCSVPAINLLFTDNELENFSTSLKVLPPLRSQEDRKALIKGIKNRTISSIISNHEPREDESKRVEFAHSDFGATGLQHAFAMARTATMEQIELERLIECFTDGPRNILGIENSAVAEDAEADLTLFDPTLAHTASEHDLKSKSKNSAALHVNLSGKAIGTVVKGNYYDAQSI